MIKTILISIMLMAHGGGCDDTSKEVGQESVQKFMEDDN